MDANKFRQIDNTTVIGDNAKLKSIGWIQTIPTEDALHDILNYWRSKDNIYFLKVNHEKNKKN